MNSIVTISIDWIIGVSIAFGLVVGLVVGLVIGAISFKE